MFRVIRIHKYTICISIPCIILFVFIFGVLAVRGAAKYGSSHYMRQNEIQEIKEMQEMQVPVLMYHSLQKNTKKHGKYVISPDMFENDLRYLKENGYTSIHVQGLIDYVYDGKPLPEKPIMLTFDDGYYDNMHYGYPLLKEYGMKAVISIVGQFCEDSTLTGDINPNYSYITWDQVKELSSSGIIEIQNHSYNMHKMSSGERYGCKINRNECETEYTRHLTEDLTRLQQKVYEVTRRFPTAFAYPFGAVCEQSLSVLKKMGFKSVFTSFEGVNVIKKGDPDSMFWLKRIVRPRNMSFEQVLAKSKRRI